MYYSLGAFNDSHLITKAEEVFGFGDIVESWKYKEHFVVLYSYSNFFVEVTHCHQNNSISDIKAITTEEAIERYVTNNELISELTKVAR